MADRLYFGTDTTREWLVATRKTLQLEQASGKRSISIAAAGVKNDMQVEVNVRSCLFQIEHDLCIRWPKEYDAAVLMPIKHVRPRYVY